MDALSGLTVAVRVGCRPHEDATEMVCAPTVAVVPFEKFAVTGVVLTVRFARPDLQAAEAVNVNACCGMVADIPLSVADPPIVPATTSFPFSMLG
jgi:hypothetical protein